MGKLSTTQFYHGNITKYTVAFGQLFSNISVERNGALRKVPVAYENQQPYIRKRNEKNPLDDVVNIRKTVPRISFSLSNLSYSPNRMTSKISSTHGSTIGVNPRFVRQFKFIPYDFGFSLSAISTSMTDILQILEQIAPYFAPNISLQVADNPLFPNNYSDVLLFLESTSIESDVSGELTGENRYHILNMNFRLEGSLYGPLPTAKTKDGIKHVILNYAELLQDNELGSSMMTFEAIVNPFEADATDVYEVEETLYDDSA